ncbi:putative NUDIX hydrolase dihydroneopterin triphosphate pyrophosphohydrolase/hydrolase [Leishmania major strain Friedlin]|uniref:Putative NUDIX hydrolase dihydroneopterin triphosphate pyrophosphohydrolase/hydrolase n=1 Tax=Leishmania major TaxID=5664 RepID=Q4Q5C8_LEIMA|nr:putative NUDIX hydrolase dihydroneopterin triphosphate pyrophosphohydrolase/hydrolase [Leishmania major strain Friedlin]CAG9580239.1 NUDIX_hydrolase_dihydroneopterin_triphosphate_pyrophosphohydrolase/hydrolase_-_putative [Leishmania major strain Friedlin]CAJ08674.1 putative NUDIX hydrolase dihydroneopterin triphosphate pyrophosphohydrolase/hydrolase [Leishmania major strain Friedlin]|eukprot:XP_001685470.1 putative NUDIX hydrolase dihydroneopterin triphosphate pyrophosphohydrolase/hydrolase [Leishmania major strain Friedlin]
MVIVRGQDGCAYRRSVQVFFVNERAQFLLCQPAGTSNVKFRQTVQGGSEGDESPQKTAQRETWEEIGVDLDKDATFLCEVHPSAAVSGEHGQAEDVRNEKNEIVSERRKEFRYKSKTWRKLGISGQELYPLLYLLKSEKLRHVDTLGSKRGVRTEFWSVAWGSLADLAEKAPPRKRAVMRSVCNAVAAAAMPLLELRGYPTSGSTNLISRAQTAV